jgi:hypothetical protein
MQQSPRRSPTLALTAIRPRLDLDRNAPFRSCLHCDDARGRSSGGKHEFVVLGVWRWPAPTTVGDPGSQETDAAPYEECNDAHARTVDPRTAHDKSGSPQHKQARRRRSPPPPLTAATHLPIPTTPRRGRDATGSSSFESQPASDRPSTRVAKRTATTPSRTGRSSRST